MSEKYRCAQCGNSAFSVFTLDGAVRISCTVCSAPASAACLREAFEKISKPAVKP